MWRYKEDLSLSGGGIAWILVVPPQTRSRCCSQEQSLEKKSCNYGRRVEEKNYHTICQQGFRTTLRLPAGHDTYGFKDALI